MVFPCIVSAYQLTPLFSVLSQGPTLDGAVVRLLGKMMIMEGGWWIWWIMDVNMDANVELYGGSGKEMPGLLVFWKSRVGWKHGHHSRS